MQQQARHAFLATSKITLALAALSLASACAGTKSTVVAELNDYDKHMNCTELQLEITEATFLRDKAERNRGLSFGNVLKPLSYPSTYMSAGDAVEASNNRIEYLSRLSEVKGCNGQQQYASAAPMPSQTGYAQPQPYYPPHAYVMPQQGAYQPMQYAQPQAMPPAMQPHGAAQSYQQARPSYSY